MTDKFDLSIFRSGNGSHWGLTDIYPDKEAALAAALASGQPFDTGWWGSKKEIASARVRGDSKTVCAEASVSDDFDTSGRGERTIPAPATIDDVKAAIDAAFDEAEENRKSNQDYAGYSLLFDGKLIGGRLKLSRRRHGKIKMRRTSSVLRCIDYYIVPAGDGRMMDSPPGDNYFYWGWQNDYTDDDDLECGKKCVEPGIPPETVGLFERFANALMTGELVVGRWRLRSWESTE